MTWRTARGAKSHCFYPAWLSGRGKRIERLDIDDLYVVITDVVDGFLILLREHKQICELNYKNNKLKLS